MRRVAKSYGDTVHPTKIQGGPLPFYPLAGREFQRGKKPTWITSVGAWGDAIAACGYAQQAMEFYELEKINLLHLGRDASVVDMFKNQPWVENTKFYRCGEEEYQHLVALACNMPISKYDWIIPVAAACGVDHAEILPTHITYWTQFEHSIQIPKRLELPEEIRSWAKDEIGHYRNVSPSGSVVLFNPRSTNSNHWTAHWSFRALPELFQWLLEDTPHHYILTGKDWDCNIVHPRLLNIIDETESMLHVFALAERCDAVIGTHNSLSMWAVTQDIPSSIWCGAGFERENYFKKWVRRGRSELVEYRDDLSQLKLEVSGFFSRHVPGSDLPKNKWGGYDPRIT